MHEIKSQRGRTYRKVGRRYVRVDPRIVCSCGRTIDARSTVELEARFRGHVAAGAGAERQRIVTKPKPAEIAALRRWAGGGR